MANEPRWYYADGRPCATVPNVASGGERKPDIRDARKLGLLPSVTTVLDVVRKPGLEAWAEYVGEDVAEERRQRAATQGLMVHAGIAQRLARWPLITADELACEDIRVAAWATWMVKQPWEPLFIEKGMAAPDERYGGTPDLVAVERETDSLIVLDWKTQATCGKQITFKDEWPVQLAAYGRMVCPDTTKAPRLVSVVISVDEPGVVVMHEWEPRRYARYLSAFYCARDLWFSALGPGVRFEESEEDDDD